MIGFRNLTILSLLMLMVLGCSNPSGDSVISHNHTPLLQPPSAFSFIQVRAFNGSVNLRWRPALRASLYRVYMGTSANNITTGIKACEGTKLTCDLTGLNQSTLYYFKVEALNAAGKRVIDKVATARSVSSFDIVSSTKGDRFITLSWENSSGATSYTILYGTSSGAYSNTISNVSSPYTLTGLTNGINYYVRVLAENAHNGYALSESQITERPFGPPTAPGGLTLSALPQELTLSWNPVVGADSYTLYRGTTSGSLVQIATGITANSYLDTPITNGTTYYYAVEAYNGYTSPRSPELAGRAIAAFDMTSVDPGTSPNQMVVTWPSVTGASQYNIRYGINPSNLNLSLSNVTSPRTVTGLTGGTTYYFRITALNSVGQGARINSNNLLSGTPIVALPAPTGVTATASPGQIRINWNTVSGASNYEVLRGTVSGSYTSLQSGILGNSFTDISISNGTTYYYVVRAHNALPSPYSTQVSAKAIANFAIASVNVVSASALEISWSATAGGDAYDVLYGTTSGNYTSSVTNISSPYTLSGLSASTNYYLVIRARNAIGSGTSLQSPQSSGLTRTVAPSGLVATTSPGKVTLDWANVPGATSYNVYRGTTSGAHTLLASLVSSSDYQDTTVTDGTPYYYIVRATNGNESTNSIEVAAKTITPFSLSTLTSVSSSSIEVSWPNTTGADSYDVMYGTASGTYTTTLTNRTSPFLITGLNSGTTYYVRVVARNSIGTGSSENSNELSQGTPVGPPTGLVASAGQGQISLSWNSMTGASSYKVYRGTTSGTYSLIASNVVATNYLDNTSITDGTIYYYVVRSYNGYDSGNSAEVAAKTIAPFSIASTTGTSPSSIEVTWNSTTGGDLYDVQYSTTTGGPYTTVSGVTSPYSITGLTANTTYYIVVRARNSVGSGSSASTPEVSRITPISAPSGLTASAIPSRVTLSWSAVSGASSYKIYRGTSSGIYSELATAITGLSYNDSTVTNGTNYYYVIKAFNGSDSANSNEVTIRPIASFAISSATVISSSIVELAWPAVTGADSYDISYGTTSGSYTSTISGVTSPYQVTSLAAASTYYFIVTAKNAIGSGTSTNSTEVGATTAFGAPSGLAAQATSGQVNLTWNAVSGASSYNVLRGTTSGSYTLIASGVGIPAYTDTAVSNGTTYYYVVRAYNGVDSDNSTEVAVRPISTFTLSSAVVDSASSITLTWAAAAGADSYDVQYGASSGVYLGTVSAVSSPYTLTGLSAGTTYYISIRAKNTIGSGTAINSNELSPTTSLNAPSGLTASATPTQVGLNWTAMSGASSYKVYRGTSSGTYSEIATGVTSAAYLDSGLTDGVVYYYVVKAHNGTDSVNSSEVAVKPIASFNFTAATAASSTSVNLTWDSATGGETYDVRYGTASGVYLGTVTNVTSPYTLTGLSAATQYYIAIRANNSVGAGTSLTSNERTVTTATSAPTSLTATATAGQVNLSWVQVSGASSYRVYRGTTSGSYSLLISGLTGTTYSDTSVINGSSYFYVIRAFNGSESANSNEASAAPLGNFSIASTTAPTSSSIQVSWNAVSGATSYDLLYGTATGTYSTTVTGVTSPHTISGLTSNTIYYLIIKAKNSVGSGTSTNSSEASQITPTTAPTSLVASGGTGLVNLSWNAVTGATSYKILRGTISGSYTEIASGITGTTYSDTGLVNGTTYYYAIKAYNGSDSASSPEGSSRPIANFAITSVEGDSSSSVLVTWEAAAGAASYDLRYGTTAGSYTNTLTGVTSPYSITGLTSGTTYYVSVVAKNAVGSGTSVNSAEASGAPNSPPIISSITDQSTPADTAIAVNFTLSDSNHLLDCATSMSGSSSNTTLVQNTGIVFSGTVPNCTGTITPVSGQVGTTTITFTANDGISTTSTSFTLTVTPCTVASIVWETQPTGMAAGNLFGTAPRVSLRKADNTLCTTNTSPVILGVSLDTSIQQDATITGVASVVPSGGYAHFTGARMERAGTGYTIEASQDGVISLASSTFDVTALAASKIVFSQEPQTTGRLATMIPAPMIRTADTYGNYVAVNGLSITLSLQSNEEGATLSGTLSKNTNNQGIAEFTNLSLDTLGNYFLTATPGSAPYTAINSATFNVLEITPQDTTAVLEMLAGPIIHVTNRTNYPRASTPFGTNTIDGVTAYTWKIVAKNTDTQNSNIRLRIGATNTNITISVPAGTTEPTLFSTTIGNANITAEGTWHIRVESGGAEVYSSRIIAKQTGANRTVAFIPLLSIENNTTTGNFSTTSTTYSSAESINFPSYAWDGNEVAKIDSAQLYVISKTGGASACAALFNKSSNTQIGSEICNASAGETAVSVPISPPALSTLVADLEVRVRSTSAAAPAYFYKAGLLLKIVSIEKMLTVQKIAPAVAGLVASSNFLEHRATSYVGDYGVGVVNEYINCVARAASSGSATLTYMDHGINTAGSASPSPISASAITYSGQTSFTILEAGPVATSYGNNQYLNYAHSSGIMDLAQCLVLTQATY